MGCTNKRETSGEENAIVLAESLLGFHMLKTKLITSAFTQHSVRDSLNDLQLEKAMNSLSLNTTIYDDRISVIAFTKKLKRMDQTYSLTHWCLIGIYLGRGKSHNKASDIFHLFKNEKDFISMDTMKETVLKTMIQISLSLGYLLPLTRAKSAKELQIDSYIEQLESIQTIAINKVAERMLYGTIKITEDVFVDVMTTFRRGALLTSTGWRSFLKTIHTSNWKNYVWGNSYSKNELK